MKRTRLDVKLPAVPKRTYAVKYARLSKVEPLGRSSLMMYTAVSSHLPFRDSHNGAPRNHRVHMQDASNLRTSLSRERTRPDLICLLRLLPTTYGLLPTM